MLCGQPSRLLSERYKNERCSISLRPRVGMVGWVGRLSDNRETKIKYNRGRYFTALPLYVRFYLHMHPTQSLKINDRSADVSRCPLIYYDLPAPPHRYRATDVLLLYCANAVQYFIFKMSSVPILPRPLISICGVVVCAEVSYILKFDSKNYTLITLRVSVSLIH